MATFDLDAKYTLPEGTILLSGTQALIRALLDQQRADERRGIRTAGLISGYRGSPLAGLDLLLQRNRTLLEAHHIRFIPGVNEDLGATMIFGSQIANLFPEPSYDGVLGMWYGKGPGVDRSGDIFKHANFAGAGRYGGVLVVTGDDPMSRSSTLPSASETALYDALMPVLAPGNIQEVIDLGRIGYELSRFSGLWVGLKLTNMVADQFGTALVGPDRPAIVRPEFSYQGRPWQPSQTHTLGSPTSLALEREIHDGRLLAAIAFAAANQLNQVVVAAPHARVGLIAAGKTYYEVRQALDGLGLDDAGLERAGIRLLRLGMLFPLDRAAIRQFAAGLDEVIIIEEKRAFLELFIRDALYDLPDRPRVLGKQDAQGHRLFPPYGELDADTLTPILARCLKLAMPSENPPASIPLIPLAGGVLRTPYFCSGCPHNRSTVTPDGSLALGGIGCHGLVHGMGRNTIGLGHMGGEGAQWAGIAPFSGTRHLFQNLGDGTLFHSGSLAIRQAIAAGTTMTYKILYNDAVGMTGGQPVDGAMPVPALTRALEAEGVRRIIVTSDDPQRYPEYARWAPGVEIWHRDRIDEAQRVLRDTPGVTVLIHDQMCAAERRRLRKRGRLPEPATRVFINQRICEGCGDCGVKSNCLSVHPVETEFGRKTEIHQSSCNKDYSCLLGDCPAFMTVEAPVVSGQSPRRHFEADAPLPEPARLARAPWNMVMMGIGGTGVVTVNQVLGTAALLEGLHVDGLDQTGLSQKGGSVVSHLKLSLLPPTGSNRIANAEADCFLAFDLLTATLPLNLARAHPERTTAVISTSQAPTGAMVANTGVAFPPPDGLLAAIQRVTRAQVQLDATKLAETYFGDYLAANMIAVGAAYQAGLLPMSASAIEQAISLNGVSVQINIHAFRLGRRSVADPEWQTRERDAARLTNDNENDHGNPALVAAAQALIAPLGATGELARLLRVRTAELIAYQNREYAQAYIAFVAKVYAAERDAMPGDTRLSEAVARYLYKLMAYKDEYEVARLALAPDQQRVLTALFGQEARVAYHLHPPLLRALGWKRKIRLGRWFESVFRLLAALKGLRGTPFDLFGYTRERRIERALIGEYRASIERALTDLSAAGYERAVQLALLPDLVRGYEQIKLDSVRRYRARLAEMSAQGEV